MSNSWRTFVTTYCTNCGADGHAAGECARIHDHSWRLAALDSASYHCQGCPERLERAS